MPFNYIPLDLTDNLLKSQIEYLRDLELASLSLK